MSGQGESGASDRLEAARLRAELAAADRRNESARAQALIDRFLTDAAAAGREPVDLQAKLISGGHLVRTNARGWYLKNDRSIAVGEQGEYYLLLVSGGWRERLAGVKLQASPPPLVVSSGGRDGESGPLSFFLDKALRG